MTVYADRWSSIRADLTDTGGSAADWQLVGRQHDHCTDPGQDWTNNIGLDKPITWATQPTDPAWNFMREKWESKDPLWICVDHGAPQRMVITRLEVLEERKDENPAMDLVLYGYRLAEATEYAAVQEAS